MLNRISLRDVIETDLPIFFEHQRNAAANRMAAFPARDRHAFMTHWVRIMQDDNVILKTILFDRQVAGNVLSFEMSGKREVGYWLGQDFWGKGIATRALTKFLVQENTRPLFAHVAKHNVASLRVLEKCGFIVSGEDIGDANGRGEKVEEYILRLGD